MEFGKDGIMFILAIIGGVIVSVISDTKHSLKAGIIRTFTGIFFAVFFCDPILHYLSFDVEVYRNATAGLLAITGYTLGKLLVSLSIEQIISWYKLLKQSSK